MMREEKYTCIFGGGAVRGFAYIGAIKALHELKLKYDTVVGSSVGSIVAALVALDYSYEEIKNIFMKVNFELFRDIHFGFKKNFALSKGEIFTNWMRENIEKKFYGAAYKKGNNKPVTFADIEKNLLVFTTDLIEFKCKEFSKQETPDFEIAQAIRISCSMPGLMTPMEIDGHKLVDGDLLKSNPLWQLSDNLKLGENRILEFRLEGEYETVENNAIDFLNAIYSCMTSASTDFIMKNYGKRDDFDYIKINTGNIIILDFNMSDSMRNKLIDLGYEQSIKYLTVDLLNKKRNIIKDYEKISKKLITLLDYIRSDSIEKSKILIGELYMILDDMSDVLSRSVYNLLKLFKEEFIVSAKGRSWLGTPRFKDKRNLLKTLSKLIYEVNTRVSKLEYSLNKVEFFAPNP